jgi:hypothetical protein
MHCIVVFLLLESILREMLAQMIAFKSNIALSDKDLGAFVLFGCSDDINFSTSMHHKGSIPGCSESFLHQNIEP